MKYLNLILIIVLIFLTGCSKLDHYIRPENSFYIPLSADIKGQTINLDGTSPIYVTCFDGEGKAVKLNGRKLPDSIDDDISHTISSDLQCMYYATDITSMISTFKNPLADDSKDKDRRSYYASFLLSLADQNCETFQNRAFANKASIDTTKNTIQDILTGSSAASAIPYPPAGAALGLISLVTGKTVDNINSTFFFEKTFQAISSAIYIERLQIKDDIRKRLKEKYLEYTFYDVLADIRRYESACSIRVGVSKLQSLAEAKVAEKAAAALVLDARAAQKIAEDKATAATSAKEIAEARTAKAIADKKIAEDKTASAISDKEKAEASEAKKAAEASEAQAILAKARAAEKEFEAKAAETRAVEARAAEIRAAEAKVAEIRAADVRAAEAKVAEIKAADVRAAETKAAATKAAATKAPETKVPETKAPETKAPETKAPETKVPETKAPETKAAEGIKREK